MACESQGLNTTFKYTLFETKAMESQDFRTFTQEILIYTIYMKSRLQKTRISELLHKKF